ncbi:MAG: O-antigen ligase family protein [Chloroflexi bacterium]|nr:O-antigen ligase family protein [Chloroflexota bacterium]
MMIGILIVFGHFQTAVTGDRKIFSMLLILGMGILLILSRSWTSYLGVGIALVFVVTARIEQSRARNISLVAALLVVIGGLIFYLPQNPLYQQVETANVFKYKLQVEQYENYNYRYQSVEASYRYFLENPVFGGGFGRAADISRIILNNPEAPLPHTGFATLMIEQGLLGLIPFLGLLMMLAQLAVQAWKGRLWGENVPVPIRILIIGVGGFLLARYLSYFFYLTLSIYFSWAALMLAAIGPRSRQNTAESAIKE